MENNTTKFWFFGSKLNTALLAILIVLMIIAIHIMLQDKEKYFRGTTSLSQVTTEQAQMQQNNVEVIDHHSNLDISQKVNTKFGIITIPQGWRVDQDYFHGDTGEIQASYFILPNSTPAYPYGEKGENFPLNSVTIDLNFTCEATKSMSPKNVYYCKDFGKEKSIYTNDQSLIYLVDSIYKEIKK